MAKTTVEHWTGLAQDQLVGRKIVKVRYMTKEEMSEWGWYHSPLILELDDGTLLYPSRDDEGNDAGALFGQDEGDEGFLFPVIARDLMGRKV
jgi:hypothetical protein